MTSDRIDEAGGALTAATLEAVRRFNDAFNRRDVDAVMALMTDDCAFENTWPPPDGERVQGHAAVEAFWRRFFAASPAAAFEWEEVLACGDRAIVRWTYRWGQDAVGAPGHVRGVDVLRVSGGKVAEKLSYVKG
jgi:ketosteroid isomerase-like protein